MQQKRGESLDLIIVGAGPIGLAATCAAQDAGLSYVCIDKGGITSTLTEFAPRQSFYSPADELEVGGVPFAIASDEKPRREDALAYYRAVVSSRKLAMRTWERLVAFGRDAAGSADYPLTVTTEQEPDHAWQCTYRARAVLLAIGVWDQPRALDVPGADLKKVSRRYEDPSPYYGKRCLVVGGGNSAAEVAMALARAGAETEMAIMEESWDACRLRPFVLREVLLLADERRINPRFLTRVVSIGTESVRLAPLAPSEAKSGDEQGEAATGGTSEAASRQEGGGGEEYDLPNDFVFTLIGNVPDTPLLRAAGLQLHADDLKPVYDEATFETTVPGVYVAGSLSREPHIFNGRGRAARIVQEIARRCGVAGHDGAAHRNGNGNGSLPRRSVSELDAPEDVTHG